MKFLLDQGTPLLTADLLRQAGFDAIHTGEIGFFEAEDMQILGRAASEERIVITLDADFHALLALSGAVRPSVIRIRIEGLKAEQLAALVKRVIIQCEQQLKGGALISVEENRVRLRRLPIL